MAQELKSRRGFQEVVAMGPPTDAPGPEGGQERGATTELMESYGRARRQEKPKEDGPVGRQGSFKEDGLAGRQGLFKEDGPGGQQDSLQEDGRDSRQALLKEDLQYEDFENGPRGRQAKECSSSRTFGGGWKYGARSRSRSKDAIRGEAESGGVRDKSLEVMALMLQSMQRMMEDREDRMESIRHAVPDLPSLPEWSGNGPIDMGDWLILLEPIMSNLSANSETWWKLTLQELQVWYEDHMKLPPLARSSHSMETPASLKDKKWTRLERRVASMLLKAIPSGAREEMISGKKTTVFAILATLPSGISTRWSCREGDHPQKPESA